MEHTPHRDKVSRAGRWADLLVALGLALAVFILDQGLKSVVEASIRAGESIPVIPGFLSITHVRNDGAAFGILGGSQLLLLVGGVVAVGVVLWMLLAEQRSRLATLACGLILGGAAGNLLDRLTNGEVTDYVHFSFWYVFNAADAAITVGVALLLLSTFRMQEKG